MKLIKLPYLKDGIRHLLRQLNKNILIINSTQSYTYIFKNFLSFCSCIYIFHINNKYISNILEIYLSLDVIDECKFKISSRFMSIKNFHSVYWLCYFQIIITEIKLTLVWLILGIIKIRSCYKREDINNPGYICTYSFIIFSELKYINALIIARSFILSQTFQRVSTKQEEKN